MPSMMGQVSFGVGLSAQESMLATTRLRRQVSASRVVTEVWSGLPSHVPAADSSFAQVSSPAIQTSGNASGASSSGKALQQAPVTDDPRNSTSQPTGRVQMFEGLEGDDFRCACERLAVREFWRTLCCGCKH